MSESGPVQWCADGVRDGRDILSWYSPCETRAGALENTAGRTVDIRGTAWCAAYADGRPTFGSKPIQTGGLTKWALTTRLETRTKEFNNQASIRVANSGAQGK